MLQAWKADATLSRLSNDMLDEIIQQVGFFPFEVRVRVLIADRAKVASDLCWDGRFKSAAITLMRYGLNSTTENPTTRELSRLNKSVAYYENRKQKDNNGANDLFSKTRRSKQWAGCK